MGADAQSAREGASSGAEGVLFAHGARVGGHALYVRGNRLHYVNSFVGQPGFISLGGEGRCVGRDSCAPVTDGYLGESP